MVLFSKNNFLDSDQEGYQVHHKNASQGAYLASPKEAFFWCTRYISFLMVMVRPKIKNNVIIIILGFFRKRSQNLPL